MIFHRGKRIEYFGHRYTKHFASKEVKKGMAVTTMMMMMMMMMLMMMMVVVVTTMTTTHLVMKKELSSKPGLSNHSHAIHSYDIHFTLIYSSSRGLLPSHKMTSSQMVEYCIGIAEVMGSDPVPSFAYQIFHPQFTYLVIHIFHSQNQFTWRKG